MDHNFIALLKAMPKPLVLGLGTAIARAILARIILPALLELTEAGLPLRAVTRYLALAVGWVPVPGGGYCVPVLPLESDFRRPAR